MIQIDDVYILDTAYHRALDRIITATAPIDDPDPWLRDTLIEILGDAGIWPASCLEDQIEERELRWKRGLKE